MGSVRSKAMSAPRVHFATQASGEAEKNDRPLSEITAEAKETAPPCIDRDAFLARKNLDFSLGNDMLEEFVNSRETEVSGDNFVRSGMRWLALAASSPDFKDVDCYMSLMAQRGVILWHGKAPPAQPEGLVIGSCDRGVVLLQVDVKRSGDLGYAKLRHDSDGNVCDYKVVHIRDSKDYVGLESKVVSKLANGETGLVLQLGLEAPMELGKIRAKSGFAGFTIDRMKKLIEHYEFEYEEKHKEGGRVGAGFGAWVSARHEPGRTVGLC